MKTVRLPRTDLDVSPICLGTGGFGADISREKSFGLLDAFVDEGGNFLDTALIYADWTPAGKGSSERTLGAWMKARNRSLVVATKGAHPELSSMSVSRMSKAEIEHDVEASLRNLGVESLDLYYLHRDAPHVAVDEILETLESLVSAGKIRFYGFSNWKLERAELARVAAERMGARGFVASQQGWSAAKPNGNGADSSLVFVDEAFRDWSWKNNVAAIPYSSQANGYFSKLARGNDSSTLPKMYESDVNRRRYQIIEELVTETGWSVSQVVLGYLLGQHFTVVPVVGPRNIEQLKDSLSAADKQLNAQQIAHLDVV